MMTRKKPVAAPGPVAIARQPLRFALWRFFRVVAAAAIAAAASELAGLGVEPLLVVPLAAFLNALAKYLRDQGALHPAVPL
jgi:hypothetical protein